MKDNNLILILKTIKIRNNYKDKYRKCQKSYSQQTLIEETVNLWKDRE